MPSAKLRKMGVTKKEYDTCIRKVGGDKAYPICNETLKRKHSKKK
jgi:hypothetical protein